MKITTRKRSLIPGAIAAAFLLYLTISLRDRFFISEKYGVLLFTLAIFVSLLTGTLASIQFHFKNVKTENIVHGIIFLLLPIVSITMVESMNNVDIYWLSPKSFIANYILYLALNLFLYAITNSLRIPIIASNIFLFIFGFTNCLVKEFRGTPFVPTDVLCVKTGLSVAHTYTYQATFNIILSWILLWFIVVCSFKLKKISFTKRINRTIRGGSLACVAVLLIVTYTTDGLANLGYKPDFWNQTRGYEKSGAFLNFYLNSKYLIVHEPNEYTSDSIETLMKNTESKITGEPVDEEDDSDVVSTSTDTSKQTPNVICIMNETLSDLSVVGDFQTNEDYMPFIRSLTKNTIKGHLYMSVKGAGTCNSEFEFLTGNSMAFMPAGSSVYELYVKKPTASLVTTLGAQGYSRHAFHSYMPDGWNRPNVYSYMGFQDFKSIYSLIDKSILDEYANEDYNIDYLESQLASNYPDQNMIIRRYISDSYDFKQVINQYENRDNTQPFFMFNVTMQNHGGYAQTYNNFPQEVYITSSKNYYPKANQYLSLIKKTDEAFKELIDYFSQQDEPTIICMFGDHQPYIEDNFYEELYGKDLNSLTLAEEQKQYITPFVIWANYDIPEEQINMLSANYLSSLLLKTAGLKMTDYNKFLLDLSQEIPVINANGYIDKDGNNYSYSDTSSPYCDLISAYEKIQYNNFFDSTNQQKNLYYLSDNPCNQNNTLIVDGTPMEPTSSDKTTFDDLYNNN